MMGGHHAISDFTEEGAIGTHRRTGSRYQNCTIDEVTAFLVGVFSPTLTTSLPDAVVSSYIVAPT